MLALVTGASGKAGASRLRRAVLLWGGYRGSVEAAFATSARSPPRCC